MIQPVEVKPLPGYRVWVEYDDGQRGEIDLSHLAGEGVFKAWDEPGCFDAVCITLHRSIAWNDDIELCADALYMELTGKRDCLSASQTPPADESRCSAQGGFDHQVRQVDQMFLCRGK